MTGGSTLYYKLREWNGALVVTKCLERSSANSVLVVTVKSADVARCIAIVKLVVSYRNNRENASSVHGADTHANSCSTVDAVATTDVVKPF